MLKHLGSLARKYISYDPAARRRYNSDHDRRDCCKPAFRGECCAGHAEQAKPRRVKDEDWSPDALDESMGRHDEHSGEKRHDGVVRIVERDRNSLREDEISEHAPSECRDECERQQADDVEAAPDR